MEIYSPSSGIVEPDVLISGVAPQNQITALAVQNLTFTTNLPTKVIDKIAAEVKTITLNKHDAQRVLHRYEDACEGVADILARIYDIAVTDAGQKEQMQEAHALRMLLVKKRGEIDEIRKEEKAEAKSRTDFVDGCGRGIRLTLEEAEQYARHQEGFAKREKEAKKEAVRVERQNALRPYMPEHAPHAFPLGLADMKEDAFVAVLDSTKEAFFARRAVKRHSQLLTYGYSPNLDELGEAMSDETFDLLLANTKTTHENKQQIELEQRKKKEGRIQQLSQIGLNYDYHTQAYRFDELTISDADVSCLNDVDFSTLVGKYRPIIADRKSAQAETQAAAAAEQVRLRELREEEERRASEQQAQERRAAAEAERLRLAPDREKFTAYFKAIHDATAAKPEFTDPNAVSLLERFFDDVATLVNKYAAEADGLGVSSDCPF